MPVLLLAPPFQIQGTTSIAPGSDPTKALWAVIGGFFIVRKASVFDADGNALGEGEQIIVNGAAVQMSATTRQHIDVATAPEFARDEPVSAIADGASAEEAHVQRAA